MVITSQAKVGAFPMPNTGALINGTSPGTPELELMTEGDCNRERILCE